MYHTHTLTQVLLILAAIFVVNTALWHINMDLFENMRLGGTVPHRHSGDGDHTAASPVHSLFTTRPHTLCPLCAAIMKHTTEPCDFAWW